MKILVISDSHNIILDSQIERIKKHGDFDVLLHCGDNFKDAGRFATKLNINTVIQVPGNCDSISNKPLILTEIIDGKKFLITHGHLHNVKLNLSELIMHAKEEKVDAVIYGHTHCTQNEIIDDILFFNPGSTIMPRCEEESFGILEINSGNIESAIISLES